ncbi:hypothetical protein C5167_001632 [Papaver somniferum]|uniref:Alpha-L-arabinofuranosidase B arabinose-binding domain-containing protein n=1 Tax=Papaver somniferum TaxID=3469 RepID=A0A4Y7KXC8_PAPSO|nr:hypothetical protein C5167_001632 [Papaver somniferum]
MENYFNSLKLFLILISVFSSTVFVVGKECTNKQLSSHSLRHQLLSSKNESWREEMFSHYHLTPTDDSAWSNLFPRKILKEEEKMDWEMMYRSLKGPDGFKKGNSFLKEVSLHDVRLNSNSFHFRAQQTNLEYLLMLDADSLVWSFRKTANLSTPGKPYGGWEAPTEELRGHFVGHYLSATAQMWASTHNYTLHEKMSGVVSALGACQTEMGTGYLSAFPSEFFDRFESMKEVWAPYYTIHKILAGLLDQYTLANNNKALRMMIWMVDYFSNRVQNVIAKYSIERHWMSLNDETGGMNKVLYNLYSITGDLKHLVLAHLFDKPCFLGLLAVQADSLSGFHANTHIPIVIGAQMRYEVTGDPLYKAIGTYFMDVVNSSHTYATGGTSVGEFWSDPKHLASSLARDTEESCTTYNMLKVSRNLFRWTKETVYADYYERALTNGVLSIQRGTDPGIMIYMLPLGPGGSKSRALHGWEQSSNHSGVVMEQFISSSLNWKSGGFIINQKVEPVASWDPYLKVTFTFSAIEKACMLSTLNLLIPSWTYSKGFKATLNTDDLPLSSPGSFLSISRKWRPDDKLTLQMPMSLRTETVQDERPEYSSVQAILYGPYLLAGLTSGDWEIKKRRVNSLSDRVTPVPSSYSSQLVSVSQASGGEEFVFTSSNSSLTMEKLPESGTDLSVHPTFRLILKDVNSSHLLSLVAYIGKSVMIEPFNLPGMLVVHNGTNNNLRVTNSEVASKEDNKASLFRVVEGLDLKDGTVSLESEH